MEAGGSGRWRGPAFGGGTSTSVMARMRSAAAARLVLPSPTSLHPIHLHHLLHLLLRLRPTAMPRKKATKLDVFTDTPAKSPTPTAKTRSSTKRHRTAADADDSASNAQLLKRQALEHKSINSTEGSLLRSRLQLKEEENSDGEDDKKPLRARAGRKKKPLVAEVKLEPEPEPEPTEEELFSRALEKLLPPDNMLPFLEILSGKAESGAQEIADLITEQGTFGWRRRHPLIADPSSQDAGLPTLSRSSEPPTSPISTSLYRPRPNPSSSRPPTALSSTHCSPKGTSTPLRPSPSAISVYQMTISRFCDFSPTSPPSTSAIPTLAPTGCTTSCVIGTTSRTSTLP